MLRALSTRLLPAQRLTTAALDRIARAGFSALEIECDRRRFDYYNRSQIDEFRHWLADSKLRVRALRAPLYNDFSGGRGGRESTVRITALDKHDRIRATDELKRALEVADRISIERFVLHLGAPEEDYDPHKIDSAFNAIDELGVFARGLGVEILLENFSNEHCSADRLNLFLAMTHVDLGYCFDAAEARAGEGFEDQFEKMRERIRMVRLDEPRREPSELELLAGLDAKTPFVLALEEDPELEDPLGDAGDALDRLEEWLNDG